MIFKAFVAPLTLGLFSAWVGVAMGVEPSEAVLCMYFPIVAGWYLGWARDCHLKRKGLR